MGPETSWNVFYIVEFVYNGYVCNVNSPIKLHFVRSRCHLLHSFQFAYNFNSAIMFFIRSPRAKAAQLAAREVVLSGPRCNKFVSRLFIFLVLCYRLKYICHQNTPTSYLLFLLWAYHPQTCITNASKICQFFRFGLHPHKLATLRATIGLIITACYRVKLMKIQVFVTSQ